VCRWHQIIVQHASTRGHQWPGHVVGSCGVAAARDHRLVPRLEAPQKALVTFVAGRSDVAAALRLGTSNTPLLMMGPPRIKGDGMKHPEGMGGEKQGWRAGLPPGSMAVTPSLSSCCKSSESKSETALVIERPARPVVIIGELFGERLSSDTAASLSLRSCSSSESSSRGSVSPRGAFASGRRNKPLEAGRLQPSAGHPRFREKGSSTGGGKVGCGVGARGIFGDASCDCWFASGQQVLGVGGDEPLSELCEGSPAAKSAGPEYSVCASLLFPRRNISLREGVGEMAHALGAGS